MVFIIQFYLHLRILSVLMDLMSLRRLKRIVSTDNLGLLSFQSLSYFALPSFLFLYERSFPHVHLAGEC